MLEPSVKVTARNQTLILAGEKPGPSDKPAFAMDARNPSLSPSRPALQRITIVETRPDATLVYVRADYAALVPATGAPQSAASAVAAPRVFGNSEKSAHRGVALYARTQALLAVAPLSAQIDVHA